MNKQKIFGILIACLVMISFVVSCSTNISETTNQTTFSSIIQTTNIETTQTQKIDETTIVNIDTTNEETTSGDVIIPPSEDVVLSDPISVKYGEYLTVVYNKQYCDVNIDVKKGLGAKETYTIKTNMKNGYIFDGYSFDKLITQASKPNSITGILDNEYEFTLETEKTIYVNYSMRIIYHGNGGTIEGQETKEETFSVSIYKTPNTKPNKNNIVRQGYVLTGYNTKEDLSGESIGVGSKCYANNSTIHLYCEWTKASDISNFEYIKEGTGYQITKYLGNEDVICIPEEIDGTYVTSIGKDAFATKNMEKIILPMHISSINQKAFANCSNLKVIECYDNIMSFDDTSIMGCSKFKTLEINTCYDMYSWWGTGTYVKYDRLFWAKDMKKIVIFGGSGTWYGYDCNILNEQFGDEYVIINLGINASMTNLFTMEFLKYYLHEGDILLWSPECGSAPLGANKLASGDASFEREISFTGYNYDNIKLIDVSKYSMILSHFAIYNKNHKTNTLPFDYSKESVNYFGDAIDVRKSNEMKYNYSFANIFKNTGSFVYMADEIKQIKENGCLVLYSFAPAQEGCASDDILNKYVSDLESIFGVTSISDYHDLLFDYKLFSDSAWHLINAGAEKRTNIVCIDLVKYLEEQN